MRITIKLLCFILVISIFGSCILSTDKYAKSEIKDSFQSATVRNYKDGFQIITWEDSENAAVRRGLHVKQDSTKGISYGNVDSYVFNDVSSNRTFNVWAKVGEWKYFGPNGILDSIVEYQKVTSIGWKVDTGEVSGITYVDSSFHVQYLKKIKLNANTK